MPLASALNPEASACSVCFVLKGPLPTTRFPAAAHCPKGEGLEGRRLVVVVAYACDRSESPSNGDGEHGWCRRGGGVEVSERPGGVTESPYGPKPHQKRKKTQHIMLSSQRRRQRRKITDDMRKKTNKQRNGKGQLCGPGRERQAGVLLRGRRNLPPTDAPPSFFFPYTNW